jgi:hypothetical protein
MKLNLPIALFATMVCAANGAQAGGAGDTIRPEIVFRTPYKNIYCSYDPNEQNFGCERIKPSYAYISTSVPIDYEDRQIRKGSKIDFVLAYGQSWKAPDGQITCWSKSSGLTCKSPEGFGFALSKTSVKKFEP